MIGGIRTLAGLKRRAAKLRRAHGITNADALERAARECGFPTYAAAQRSLG